MWTFAHFQLHLFAVVVVIVVVKQNKRGLFLFHNTIVFAYPYHHRMCFSRCWHASVYYVWKLFLFFLFFVVSRCLCCSNTQTQMIYGRETVNCRFSFCLPSAHRGRKMSMYSAHCVLVVISAVSELTNHFHRKRLPTKRFSRCWILNKTRFEAALTFWWNCKRYTLRCSVIVFHFRRVHTTTADHNIGHDDLAARIFDHLDCASVRQGQPIPNVTRGYLNGFIRYCCECCYCSSWPTRCPPLFHRTKYLYYQVKNQKKHFHFANVNEYKWTHVLLGVNCVICWWCRFVFATCALLYIRSLLFCFGQVSPFVSSLAQWPTPPSP